MALLVAALWSLVLPGPGYPAGPTAGGDVPGASAVAEPAPLAFELPAFSGPAHAPLRDEAREPGPFLSQEQTEGSEESAADASTRLIVP